MRIQQVTGGRSTVPRKQNERTPVSIPVSIELEGKTYYGSYIVVRGMITVSAGGGVKTTQVGSTPVDMLAKMLLSELVHQGKA